MDNSVLSRSSIKGCVLCLVSFLSQSSANYRFCKINSLFFCVFAEVVLIYAKIFRWAKKGEKYFGIYGNYFSKNTKNMEIKLQICKFTEPVICRWLGQKRHKKQHTTFDRWTGPFKRKRMVKSLKKPKLFNQYEYALQLLLLALSTFFDSKWTSLLIQVGLQSDPTLCSNDISYHD